VFLRLSNRSFEKCRQGGETINLSLCLTKHYAMKTYGGSGYIEPRFLDLGTTSRWVVTFTPLPLYPRRKNPRYPWDRKLGGPQRRARWYGNRTFVNLPGLERRLSVSQPVASRHTDRANAASGAWGICETLSFYFCSFRQTFIFPVGFEPTIRVRFMRWIARPLWSGPGPLMNHK
jgi:hypothetical protein